MDKFLTQTLQYQEEIKKINLVNSQKALEKTKELGTYIMDFKSRPDIDAVLTNSLRAEAYLDSCFMEIDLPDDFKIQMAISMSANEKFFNYRRENCISIMSDFVFKNINDKIKCPYHNDFEAASPDFSIIPFLYPLLNEVPEILLEQAIEKEKTLLSQEIKPVMDNLVQQAVNTKKTSKI